MMRIILFFVFLIFVSACSTEYNLATQKQETLLYGTDKEVSIGDSVARQLEAQYDLVGEIDVNERVRAIMSKIVDVCDRKDVVYLIKVVDDEEEDIINAISLPGGYVYLFAGLVDAVENDDQLAGVIAHEVAHINARHGIKRLQGIYGATVLQVLAAGAGVGAGANLAIHSLFSEYSQQDELESDSLGVKYMKKAGYNPEEMINFMKILEREQSKNPTRPFSYFKTHPGIARRISNINKEIQGKLEFKDYLNLMNNP